MADEKTHASTRLVFILDGEYSEGVSSRAKYAAKHLAEIASISVLLAAAHCIAIGFLTCWPNALACPVFTFLAFTFLAFDGLCTLVALASAYTLLKTANEANTMRNSKFNVCLIVRQALYKIQLPSPSGAECCDIPDDLRRLLYLIDHHSHVGVRVFIMILFSAVFSLVSFYAFIITTRPVIVWASVLVVLIPATVMLLVSGVPPLLDVISF